MQLPRTELRKKMLKAYDQNYQQYNYGFHWTGQVNFRGDPKPSQWMEDTRREWIPRRAEILGRRAMIEQGVIEAEAEEEET